MPPTRKKEWPEARFSAGTKERYADLIRRLYDLPLDVDDNGRPVPQNLPFTADGKRAWVAFFHRFAELQHKTHDDDLSAALAKLEGAAARIALVFHCVRFVMADPTLADPAAVDAISIETGVTLAQWFAYGIDRIYHHIQESDEARERRELVEFIRSRAGEITARELMHADRRYRPTAVAKDALDELVKSGIGEWIPPLPGLRGGRPSTRFRLKIGDTESSPGKATLAGTVTETPAQRIENEGIGYGGAGDKHEYRDTETG